jgi:replicative DNA helicase
LSDNEVKNQASTNASFGQYGQHFQRKVVQALLADPTWAEQMSEVLEPHYFDLKYLHYLADRYLQYARKYKAYPTLQLLVTIVKDELKQNSDVALREQVVEYIKGLRASPDMGDLPMVKEKALEFCKRQALKRALEKTVDLIETEKYEAIVDTIKQAVSAGTTSGLGHDLFEDVESRYVTLRRSCIMTGIPELDELKVMNGGSGRGELHVVIAATGVGKSHFLTMIGANAMRQGFNVLYYSFELSEPKVGIRFDSNFTDIDSNDILERKNDVDEFYSNNKLGRLKIKYYPTNQPTVNTLRSHVEKLSLRGFVPDVVIVDYADIMRSSRQYDSPRHELKLIYEELRAFAAERNIALWTASQSNREGSTLEIVDMNNMSEAYAKAFIADFILTISRKSSERAEGFGRLYVAKNRNGRDGLVFPAKIDTARSKFSVVGEHTTPEDAKEQDQADIRKALKDRFQRYEKLDLKKVG